MIHIYELRRQHAEEMARLAKPVKRIEKSPSPALEPLSDQEKALYCKVQTARFPPATAAKRFMQGDAEMVKLSDKGRAFFAYIAHRFRRQYVLTADEQAWIEQWKA
jgi:hypothetical protein